MGDAPRLNMSAGLSSPQICFQSETSVSVFISETLFATTVFSDFDCVFIHASTILESHHKYCREIFKFKACRTPFTSRDSSKAPQSSRRGKVVSRKGATLDFAHIKFTS